MKVSDFREDVQEKCHECGAPTLGYADWVAKMLREAKLWPPYNHLDKELP